MIYVDNYVIDKPIIEILDEIKILIHNGKLSSYRKTGSGIKVTCPVHNNGREQKPSCYIRESDGVYHCFACSSKGPFYTFVAHCFETSEEEAKQWLIQKYGVKTSEKFIIGDDIERNYNHSKYQAYIDKNILKEFKDWTPYFKTRGITRETAKRFNLKYDAEHRLAVFPCYDIKGNLVMLHTRSIDRKTFCLDKDVPKPVFGLYNIIRDGETKAVITEGPFDALKASQFGIPGCATLGNLSPSQIEQINESGIKTLYIMFDNDVHGREFAETLKKNLSKSIIFYEPELPLDKKDIGELNYEEFWNAINNCTNEIKRKKSQIIIV